MEGVYVDNILLTGFYNRTKVDVGLDDGPWWTQFGKDDEWNIDVDTSLHDDGNRTLKAVSYYGPFRYSFSIMSVVLDNSPPEIVTWSNSTAVMGQDLYLEMAATDLSGVDTVALSYSVNNGQYQDIIMEKGSGNTWMKNISIPVDAVQVNVKFITKDIFGNMLYGPANNIFPDDPYDPTIFGDMSDNVAYTGDLYNFNVSASDNVLVQEVRVEYWFDPGERLELLLEEDVRYSGEVQIPLNATFLSYIFHAKDIYANTASTAEINVPVHDNDLPLMSSDLSSGSAFTGDEFEFCVNVSDNICVKDVHVVYWFEGRAEINGSMVLVDDYVFQIELPGDIVGNLSYYFSVCDASLNWNISSAYAREIIDNDKPGVMDDLTKDQGTTGDPFLFVMEPMDNIGVEGVSVEYWFGKAKANNKTMAENGSGFEYSLILPEDSLDQLHYVFHIRDGTGNYHSTEMGNVSLVDNDSPVSISQGNLSADQGDRVEFDGGDSTDNIGVVNFTWSFTYQENVQSLFGISPGFIFATSGSYVVTLKVKDAAGNGGESGFAVVIKDIEDPLADPGDDMYVEVAEKFTLDGSGSLDNVGIENYTWEAKIDGDKVYYYGMKPSLAIDLPGNYSFELTVLDKAGNSHKAKVSIDVGEPSSDGGDGDGDGGGSPKPKPSSTDDEEGSGGIPFSANTVMAGGVGLGVLLLIIFVLVIILVKRKKKGEGPADVEEPDSFPDEPDPSPSTDKDEELEVIIKDVPALEKTKRKAPKKRVVKTKPRKARDKDEKADFNTTLDELFDPDEEVEASEVEEGMEISDEDLSDPDEETDFAPDEKEEVIDEAEEEEEEEEEDQDDFDEKEALGSLMDELDALETSEEEGDLALDGSDSAQVSEENPLDGDIEIEFDDRESEAFEDSDAVEDLGDWEG